MYVNFLFLAPNPVTPGWEQGFVAVSNYQIFTSSTGNLDSFTLLESVNYTLYQAWSVSKGPNQWVVKLAKIPEETITSNTIFELYTVTINIGFSVSNPKSIGFNSKGDYGLSYSSETSEYISACKQGIISSTNGIEWNLKTAREDYFQFLNLQCAGHRCVGITPDAVVFDSANSGTSYEEIQLNGVSFIAQNYPAVSYASDPSKSVYVIATSGGIIYSSESSGYWISTGASIEDSSNFNGCSESINANSSFIYNCIDRIIYTTNGETWESNSYKISNVHSLTSLQGNDEYLVGFANENQIYTSTNLGNNWSLSVEFLLHPTDSFQIYNLMYQKQRWIITATDSWINEEENKSEDIAVVIYSTDAIQWHVYSSSIFLYDIKYSNGLSKYIGAGKYGLYISSNLYDWTRTAATNAECTRISTDGAFTFVAICFNTGQNGERDTIILSSDDGAETWNFYYSPCSQRTSVPGEVAFISCNGLTYVENMDAYILYSQQPSGVMYVTFDNGKEWQLANFPFASRILDISSDDDSDLLSILTTDDIFISNSFHATGNLIPSTSYPKDVSPPEIPKYSLPPGYLLTEPVDISSSEIPTTISTDFDLSTWIENRTGPDSSGGLTGGGIFGIILAILFFPCIIFVMVAAVLIFRYKQARNRYNEQTKLLNDENDML